MKQSGPREIIHYSWVKLLKELDWASFKRPVTSFTQAVTTEPLGRVCQASFVECPGVFVFCGGAFGLRRFKGLGF